MLITPPDKAASLGGFPCLVYQARDSLKGERMNRITPESKKLYLNGKGSNWKCVDLDHHDIIRRVINRDLEARLRVNNTRDIFAKTYYRNDKGELLHEYVEWREDGHELRNDQIPSWEAVEVLVVPEDIQALYQQEGPIGVKAIFGKIERSENDPGQPEISIRKIIEAETFPLRLDDIFVLLDDVLEIQEKQGSGFIPYPKALKALAERLQATPVELAAWVSLEPENGGLAAYTNANELNPPPPFSFFSHLGEPDYMSLLNACWFRKDDIDRFKPTERFITGKALIERWGNVPGITPKAFIGAKIAESRLLDMHPTDSHNCEIGSGNLSRLLDALFEMREVEQIEAEDGIFPSLTLALEGWFGKPLEELPEAKRQRIKESPVLLALWDQLSPEQRHDAARQWDYQHDPAIEQDRQYYLNLAAREYELEEEIRELELAGAPTADVVIQKKARLEELRRELVQVRALLQQEMPEGGVEPAAADAPSLVSKPQPTPTEVSLTDKDLAVSLSPPTQAEPPVEGARELAKLFNNNVNRKKTYTEKQVVQILRDNDILPPSRGRNVRQALTADRAAVIQCARGHKK